MIKVRPADKKDVFIQEAKDGDTAWTSQVKVIFLQAILLILAQISYLINGSYLVHDSLRTL